MTRYEVVRRWDAAGASTLLQCTLETGRTHQIRVHLAAIGHPVVGDDRYRRGRRTGPPGLAGMAAGRPFLHAEVLGFGHPGTGLVLRFESGLPPDLQQVVDELDLGRRSPAHDPAGP